MKSELPALYIDELAVLCMAVEKQASCIIRTTPYDYKDKQYIPAERVRAAITAVYARAEDPVKSFMFLIEKLEGLLKEA